MAEPLHSIFDAARDGRVEDVRRYVKEDAGLMNAVDENGWTPLMNAALLGRSKVVQYLVDHGAEVNHRTPQGFLALVSAFAGSMRNDRGHLAVVEILLQRGLGLPPIGRIGKGKPFLLQAAAKGSSALVGLLLAHGRTDVDVMDPRGTALLYACRKGFMEIVMQLLEAGADPAVQRTGADDQSPYEAAVENGHEDVISILQMWDRAYMLTRARRVLDGVQEVLSTKERSRTHAAPAYLRGRVRAVGWRDGDAVELPQVEVGADHGVHEECVEESLAAERRSDRQVEAQSKSENSRGVVARHVLQELSGELFVELMGMCELTTDDLEEDEEEGSGDDGDDDADGDDDEYESASSDSDDN